MKSVSWITLAMVMVFSITFAGKTAGFDTQVREMAAKQEAARQSTASSGTALSSENMQNLMHLNLGLKK